MGVVGASVGVSSPALHSHGVLSGRGRGRTHPGVRGSGGGGGGRVGH